MKTFRAYNRRYRNRRIGEFLKELHLTEGRNTGFLKIRKALRQNGSPEPVFETDDERTYFTTTLFIHPDFQTEEVTAVKVTDRVTDRVTDKEKPLLKTIEQLPSGTYAKYANILKISRKSVAEMKKSLKEKGIIERIGSDRKGYWEIAEAN